MKNKRMKINSGSNEKTQNPLQKNTTLKNREQLRKRLKGLLAKDKNHHHLLVSNDKTVKGALTKNVNKNVANFKLKTKATPAKIKNPKQNDVSNVNKVKSDIASNGVSLKRKSKGKIEPAKKAPKLINKAGNVNKTAMNTKKNKKTKQGADIASNGVSLKRKKKKTKQGVTSNLNTLTKLKKSNEMQSIRPQSSNKPNMLSKQKVVQNPGLEKKAKKKVKKAKSYRGPIRPHTSESDSDDCLQKKPSQKKLKNKVKPLKNDNIRNDKQLGGLLRPNTSESETNGNMSPSPKYKLKVDQKPAKVPIGNDEKALTRFLYKHDNTSDESYKEHDEDGYDTDDYEYSSSEDSCEFNSYDDDDDCEDEDDYSTESYDNFSDSQGGESGDESCFDESDVTYELPPNVAEDVYIASGTAVKHDLSETNEFNFDSDTSCAQIIEMPLTTIKQTFSTITNILPETSNEAKSCIEVDKANESDDSCPELVPINDYSPMTRETDSDCSDCMSFSGSDFDSEAPYSEENEHSAEPPQMKPEIFQADKSANELLDFNIFQGVNSSSRSFAEDSPLNRIANAKGKKAEYKVITTNNEVLSSTVNVKEKSQMEKPLLAKSNGSKGSKSNPISETESDLSEKPFEEQSFESPVTENKTPEKPKAAPKTTVHANSQFRTLFFNAINSNHVIALVKDPMYIYGTVKAKLIAGSLDIFGYTPKLNETLEIFSPRGYSSLKIEASPSSGTNASLNEKELLSLTPYFIRTDLEEVIKKFDATKDAIVILERNDRTKKVNMLRKYMVEHLFPNMNTLLSDRPFYTSEFLLRCIITSTTDKALVVDPRWRSVTLNENSRVMAIGGKSVGKSTLVRYLINRNLNKYPKILLIDLDIGQPEMFVPQTISATTLTSPLLGPGYFLNKEPDKAYVVGHTNIVLMPHRYIESVQALIEYCKANKEYANIPWLVNTMGYNKGFGDEIIAVICHHLNPTTVIQVECKREINNFDVIMNKDNLKSLECTIIGDMIKSDPEFRPQHNFTLMPSVIPNNEQYQNEWDMNPRDMRLAMIISRLSNILSGHAEWLTDIKPVSASFDDLQILNMGDDQMNTEDLFKALVGNLVYLCQQKTGQPTECLGIGIVRGIDYSLKQLYLLPATPLDVLRNVNCLAICGIPLPSSILINQGPKVKGVAAFVYNTIDKASSMYIKQIYNRPEHFLTGRHKSVAE